MRIVIKHVDPTQPPVVVGEYASLIEAIEANKSFLEDADLEGYDLSDADMDCANLQGANLYGADMQGIRLQQANLRGANLRHADLSGAEMPGADLTGADLTGASLATCNLAGATGLPAAPTIEKPHTKILAKAEAGNLAMKSFHGCATTHCWAGWAVHLAGPAGYALENEYGTDAAGALILLASSPELNGVVPDFYGTDEEAILEIRELAALEAAR